MQGRNTQVARIYRILNILEGAPQGLTAREIRQRLRERDHTVSRRTVYRDLEALSEAGFPLFPGDHDNDENVTRWTLERGTKVQQYFALTSKEIFALHLAQGMLAPRGQTPFHADLAQALGKIHEKLGTRHQQYVKALSSEVCFEAGPGSNVLFDPEVLETVRAACAEGQVLSLDYESARSRSGLRRRLGPHYVCFAGGSVYLVAEDLSSSRTKLFALPRMKNVVMEDEPYDRKNTDPGKLFESSFGLFFGGTPVEVKICFARGWSSYIQERTWHATQKLEQTKDGAAVLSMRVSPTPELVRWVLGFGPGAEVLEPESLRAEVRSVMLQAAEVYAGKKPRCK